MNRVETINVSKDVGKIGAEYMKAAINSGVYNPAEIETPLHFGRRLIGSQILQGVV